MLGIAGAAFAAPRMLILQIDVPTPKDATNPNIPVANYFAQEMDEGGKVSAIVWGMTDPIFREAAMSGKLKEVPKDPKLNDAFGIARQLNAEYVATIQAYREGRNVRGHLRLYKNGKQVWMTTDTLTVATQSDSDAVANALAVARSLGFKTNSEGLRGLAVEAKAQTPEPEKGQSPVVATVPVPAPAKTDNATLRAELATLEKDGKHIAATLALRDAVDAAPLDLERRKLLVAALGKTNPEAAAMEARRAADLIPEAIDLRISAAKSWLRLGRVTEAREDLNAAVVRQPDAAETRLLMAEVDLRRLDATAALSHVEAALKAEPSSDAHFLRAVARAILGGVDGVKMDVQKVTEHPEDRYLLADDVLGRLFDTVALEMRSLQQKAAVRRSDPSVKEGLDQVLRQVSARVALQTSLKPPAEESKRHDRKILAIKLLNQAALDLLAFLGSGNEDAMIDSRINLGEAIKQKNDAKAPAK